MLPSMARPATKYRHEQSGEAEPAVLRLLLLHVLGGFHGVGAGGRRQRTGYVLRAGTRPVETAIHKEETGWSWTLYASTTAIRPCLAAKRRSGPVSGSAGIV